RGRGYGCGGGVETLPSARALLKCSGLVSVTAKLRMRSKFKTRFGDSEGLSVVGLERELTGAMACVVQRFAARIHELEPLSAFTTLVIKSSHEMIKRSIGSVIAIGAIVLKVKIATFIVRGVGRLFICKVNCQDAAVTGFNVYDKLCRRPAHVYGYALARLG